MDTIAPKHTPGPWTVPHFAEPDVNCKCGYVLTDTMMGAVATVHCSGDGNWEAAGDNPKFAEAVANARLIAAAPDMLAALIRAEKTFRWYGDLHAAKEQTPDNAAKTRRNYDEAAACAAAIAKATGA